LNPIHWNERVATEVGLPGVIAHGMLTMGLAARAVSAWAGDPGALVEYTVRFGRPVVVPDDGTGAEVTVRGRVAALDGTRARVDPARPRVDLDMRLSDDLHTVTGTERVRFTPDRPVSQLVFRLVPNGPGSAAAGNRLTVDAVDGADVASGSYDAAGAAGPGG